MLKTLFFGSSVYSLPILESLHKNTKICAILTQPDKPVGRHHTMTPTPIKIFGQTHGVPVYTPRNKNELLDLTDTLKELKPDIAVVASYGLIIPETIFTIPKFQTLNIHFGKLPKYRGASPVQWSVAGGEKSIPITIFQMDIGLDTGPIVWEKDVPVSGPDTAPEIFVKMFTVMGEELPGVLTGYIDNKLKPVPQKNTESLTTKQFSRSDGFIPWELLKTVLSESSSTIESSKLLNNQDSKLLSPVFLYSLKNCDTVASAISRLWRALAPWPGLWTEIKLVHDPIRKRMKILNVHLENSAKLVIDEVQLEGKKPVSWNQFLSGYPDIFD